jgi:NAD(P)H-flavin reductase
MTPEVASVVGAHSSDTRADPMRPVPHCVVSNKRETHDSCTLTLAPVVTPRGLSENRQAVAEEPPPCATPGQFNMLWAWGLGEAAISFSATPSSNQLVHTLRDVGPVTNALCKLAPGEQVGVRGPFGLGWPVESARGRDVILVAGGIGLAPLRPVVHHILTDRSAFGTVTLVVGARKVHDLVFRRELDDWRLHQRIQVRVTVDHPCSHWIGSVGIVTQELRRVLVDGDNTVAMICGPEVMMRFVAADLGDLGVGPDQIAVSMERNMQCGIGLCGHCQLGGSFVCTDGPVFTWREAGPLMEVREL